MNSPRLLTSLTASSNRRHPAATSALYSPSECPATKSGLGMRPCNTRSAAIDVVSIAGCVLAVSLSASSGPSKHIAERFSSRAASASSNTRRALSSESANSLPIPTSCEPCPGKMNASFILFFNEQSSASSRRASANLRFDPAIDVSLAEVARHPYRVPDGPRIRPAVTYNRYSVYAEERGAAVLGIVEPLLEALNRGLRQKCARLCLKRCLKLFLQHTHHRFYKTFADLQRDVAGKAVADDHVRFAGVHIATFDIADKIQRRFFQELERFLRKVVALDLFFADGEQAHPGIRYSEYNVRKERAHNRELVKVERLAFGVGSNVEYHGALSADGRHHSGKRGTVDIRKRADNQF